MSEARVLVLHMQSQTALIKKGCSDCPAELSEVYKGAENHHEFDSNSDVSCKLEVFEKKGGSPSKLWIRNDHHPQRCLARVGSRICWLDVWSKSQADAHWEVEFQNVEYQAEQKLGSGNRYRISNETKAIVVFKSPGKNQYLCVNNQGDLKMTNTFGPNCQWGLVPAKGAFTPGQAASIAIGGTVVAAGAITVTVLTCGAATAGAAATSAATAATTSAECTSAAVLVAGNLAAEASAAATAANAGCLGLVGGYATGAVGTAATATTAAATAAAEAAAAAAMTAQLGAAATTASVAAAAAAGTATVGAGGAFVAGIAGSAAIALPMIADAKNPALWTFKC